MTKVLVVDDDAELCKIYERVLKNYGFTTITARDGTEALSKFTKKKPDLVMLDCDMPDHSGLEIARDILAESHDRSGHDNWA